MISGGEIKTVFPQQPPEQGMKLRQERRVYDNRASRSDPRFLAFCPIMIEVRHILVRAQLYLYFINFLQYFLIWSESFYR